MTAHPIAIQFYGHGCMNELTTERTLNCKLRGSLVCLAYLFLTLDMGVCTTKHSQTSGRLMQEIIVVTVYREQGIFWSMYSFVMGHAKHPFALCEDSATLFILNLSTRTGVWNSVHLHKKRRRITPSKDCICIDAHNFTSARSLYGTRSWFPTHSSN